MRNRLFRHTIRCLGAMAVVAACLSTGCAQFNVKEKFSLAFKSDKDEPQPPSRVLAVWVDTIRYTQGEAPTRGFGGRLTFYTDGEEEPVKVDGDLVVYAFDEDGRNGTIRDRRENTCFGPINWRTITVSRRSEILIASSFPGTRWAASARRSA